VPLFTEPALRLVDALVKPSGRSLIRFVPGTR
jgi:hypothetical protein